MSLFKFSLIDNFPIDYGKLSSPIGKITITNKTGVAMKLNSLSFADERSTGNELGGWVELPNKEIKNSESASCTLKDDNNILTSPIGINYSLDSQAGGDINIQINEMGHIGDSVVNISTDTGSATCPERYVNAIFQYKFGGNFTPSEIHVTLHGHIRSRDLDFFEYDPLHNHKGLHEFKPFKLATVMNNGRLNVDIPNLKNVTTLYLSAYPHVEEDFWHEKLTPKELLWGYHQRHCICLGLASTEFPQEMVMSGMHYNVSGYYNSEKPFNYTFFSRVAVKA